MGSDVITIDFDGEIPAEDLPELEKKANQAIYDNLPLHIWYPSPEELPGVPYRTKRALPWPVRVVEIPGYDMCACCGVHVAATGEIGLIKLLSCIRFRSGVRMEMLCGARALRYLTEIYRQNLEVSHAFSAKLLETGAAARTANETLDGLKAQIGTLRQEIFRGLAEKSRGAGDVLLFGENLDSVQVRQLADLTAEVCCGTAAVFSGNDARGYAYCLVTRSGDLRELGKQMNAALSGRGGGKPVFQQGSVRCSGEKIREFLESFREIS